MDIQITGKEKGFPTMLAYIMPLCHVHSFMKVTIHRTAEVFSTMLPGIRLLSNVIVFMTVINTEFGEGFSKMYRSIWLLYFVSYFYLSKHVTYLNVLPHCLQMYLFSSIWLFFVVGNVTGINEGFFTDITYKLFHFFMDFFIILAIRESH